MLVHMAHAFTWHMHVTYLAHVTCLSTYPCLCPQLEAQLAQAKLAVGGQAAAGQLSDSLKMEVEELSKKLSSELEAKGKLVETNQSLQKVCVCVCVCVSAHYDHLWALGAGPGGSRCLSGTLLVVSFAAFAC